MLGRDFLELSACLEACSLVDNMKKGCPVNIYNVYYNIVVKLDIFLSYKLESTRRFSVLLVVLVVLSEIFKSLSLDVVMASAYKQYL